MDAKIRKRVAESSATLQQSAGLVYQQLDELQQGPLMTALPELAVILNAQQYLVLFSVDLSIALNDAADERPGLAGSYYDRQLLLVLYSAAESIPDVFGTKYIQHIFEYVGDPKLGADLVKARHDIEQQFTLIRKEFADVRNGLLGHRTKLTPALRRRLLAKVDRGRLLDIAIGLNAALMPVLYSISEFWKVLVNAFQSTPPPPRSST